MGILHEYDYLIPHGIPEFNSAGYLDPYSPGTSPAQRDCMSPYKTTVLDIIKKFGVSQHRLEFLDGLLKYRQALRSRGIVEAFQWIGGSFITQKEEFQGKEPKDIDVVTFYVASKELASSLKEEIKLKRQNSVMNHGTILEKYNIDSYYHYLGGGYESQAEAYCIDSGYGCHIYMIRYWFGLFTHTRGDDQWKGLLQVELDVDDSLAVAELERRLENEEIK